jgi:hypothetical protein
MMVRRRALAVLAEQAETRSQNDYPQMKYALLSGLGLMILVTRE